MKPQDIAFFVITCALFTRREPRAFVWAGLAGLVLAMPLFAKWIFFTAERLTWYASAWFLIASVLFFMDKKKGRI